MTTAAATDRKRLAPDTRALPLQYRAVAVQRAAINEAERTVELAFSSEQPYERWFGVEVLDHAKKAMRMDRLTNGAALLMDHNMRDQVGVVERAWIGEDRVGRAVVRFSKGARAQEIFVDIIDGIRSLVSVGYAVHEMVLEKSTDQMDTYRVTDWEPYEISIVAVPADATVGVGRAAHPEEIPVRIQRSADVPPPQGIPSQGARLMEVKDNAPAGAAADTAPGISPDNLRRLEQARCEQLARLADANRVDAGIVTRWIQTNVSVDKAAEEVIDILAKRATDGAVMGKLDMSKREIKEYSLLRAIGAVVDQNWKNAGIELEASQEIQKRLGRAPQSNNAFFVPFDVQSRAMDVSDEAIEREVARRVSRITGRRDLTVGTANAGGYLVGTSNQGFIELLRNQTALYNLGARRLGGLTDSITIPRQSSGATAYWLSTEATAITESQLVLGQVAMTPKSVGAYTEISRQLTLQSNPDAETLVMADLAAQVAIDIDAKGLNGSGASGQPTGLINTSGVGSVTGTSIAWAGIIEFMTDVFGGNALSGACAYLGTGTVAGLLMQRVKVASTYSPIWEGRLDDGAVHGYRAMASNQVPSGYLIFGDFSQMIVGEWGVLEVDVNPYANFQAGIIGVRAMASIDIAVRVPGAFSIASSVT